MIDLSKFNSLFDLMSYFTTEDICKQTIIETRWGADENQDVVCPYCGLHHCNTVKSGRYNCPKCGNKFSYKVGTIFENTKVSLKKWFIAMYLVSCHKKGVSSVQLATDIHVTQKTAWYMLQKIRTLFAQNKNEVLDGEIELDEMYLGGLEKNKHGNKRTAGTQGRGSQKTKACIFGIAQRLYIYNDRTKQTEMHYYVKAMHVVDTKRTTISPIIEKFVNKDGTVVITDESNIYGGLVKMGYDHYYVNHSLREFSDGEGVTTNGIEGFWGYFKRVILGTYHYVSKKHLQAYLDEATYRWNTRSIEEGERFEDMFTKSIGIVKYKTIRSKEGDNCAMYV